MQNTTSYRDAGPDKMPKVLIVSPEIHPLAKTGGLADVAGSLPIALKALGCDVRLAMPRHRKVSAPLRYLSDFPVMMGKGIEETAIVKETPLKEGIPVYLIENYRYFNRDSLYGYGDDAERYGFFCRAVLEMLSYIDWIPDIIHCNDWQSALVPTYLKFIYKPQGRLVNTGTLFTIHNMEYQGCFSSPEYEILGLGWELFSPAGIEFFGAFNLMKAGIMYSDMVNTVSETYSREIQTPEYGARLDGLLRAYSEKLRGIVNGIDYDVWNPEKDAALKQPFSGKSLYNRVKNKSALQKELGLEQDPASFLLGFIGRLTIQKGIDIFVPVLPELLEDGVQVVVLGTGDEHYMRMMKEIADNCGRGCRVVIKFDDPLARRIYAGSDAFLMPSRYEPCGLGQMMSFRYGSVPIVRQTGGLADTVSDATGNPEGNGFVFSDYTPDSLRDAVERARTAFADPARWGRIVSNGMSRDLSWKASARKYLETYKEVLRRAGG